MISFTSRKSNSLMAKAMARPCDRFMVVVRFRIFERIEYEVRTNRRLTRPCGAQISADQRSEGGENQRFIFALSFSTSVNAGPSCG